jgi:hypothetical protein
LRLQRVGGDRRAGERESKAGKGDRPHPAAYRHAYGAKRPVWGMSDGVHAQLHVLMRLSAAVTPFSE